MYLYTCLSLLADSKLIWKKTRKSSTVIPYILIFFILPERSILYSIVHLNMNGFDFKKDYKLFFCQKMELYLMTLNRHWKMKISTFFSMMFQVAKILTEGFSHLNIFTYIETYLFIFFHIKPFWYYQKQKMLCFVIAKKLLCLTNCAIEVALSIFFFVPILFK